MDTNKQQDANKIDPYLRNAMGMAFCRHELLREESDESESNFYDELIKFDYEGQADVIRDVVSWIFEDYQGPEDDDVYLTHGMVVLAYIRAAQLAADDNNVGLSWLHVSEAHYWLGAASSRREANPDPRTVRSELARSAAKKRHDETRKLKEEALALWRERVDPSWSNERAAEFLKRYIPLKSRTLSGYVAEAKKK